MAACMLSSCSAEPYRYNLIVFERSAGKLLADGVGKPEYCKALFEPSVYLGPVIDIPKDAAVFGTLVVTRKEELKAIPLYIWQDKSGGRNFGCNGPGPQFAHHAKTEKELVKSLTGTLSELNHSRIDGGTTSTHATQQSPPQPSAEGRSATIQDLCAVSAALHPGMASGDVIRILNQHGTQLSGATGGTVSTSASVVLKDGSQLLLFFQKGQPGSDRTSYDTLTHWQLTSPKEHTPAQSHNNGDKSHSLEESRRCQDLRWQPESRARKK